MSCDAKKRKGGSSIFGNIGVFCYAVIAEMQTAMQLTAYRKNNFGDGVQGMRARRYPSTGSALPLVLYGEKLE